MKRIILSFFLPLIVLENSFAGGDFIENIFPEAFSSPTGIKVHSKTIGGVDGYAIEKFSEEEKNRNHGDSRNGEKVQFLVMHYTVSDFPTTLDLFTKNIDSGRVSAHYVITQAEKKHKVTGGIPVQVIPEEKRSWHAGISGWRKTKNLNATSIGIENVNSGFTKEESTQNLTWFSFDSNQINTLGKLSQDIIKKYEILAPNVIGHADIAPTRKQDPGILFPWGKLYKDYNVGAWLSDEEMTSEYISTKYVPREKLPQGVSTPFFLTSLQNYGYEMSDTASLTPENEEIVKAFKAHFSHNQNPEGYSALIDPDAMFWAWALGAKYKQQ